jgi:hypothetical protein
VFLARRGRVEEALVHLDEIVRLAPDDAGAYNNRAMIRATTSVPKYRDGRRAVEDATHACTLTGWTNPSYLDTCAAAYAEAGDFEKATTFQTRAIERLDDGVLREEFQSRLARYQARQPYREAPTIR